MQTDIQLLQSVFLVPLTLLPIINPVGNVPIFTALSGGNPAIAAPMARQVATNACVILTVSMLVGTYVLDLFGISLAIVRVAGGLLVAATGWRMLQAPDEDPVRHAVAGQAAALSSRELARRSFFPMSFPLTTGPGSIATAIALGTATPATTATHVLAGGVVALCGSLLTAAAVYFSYRFGTLLLQRLGEIGTLVMTRFAAFILLCIGLQMVWTGWLDLPSSAP